MHGERQKVFLCARSGNLRVGEISSRVSAYAKIADGKAGRK